jgi:hypothetical protein
MENRMKPTRSDVDIETIAVPCAVKDLQATFEWLLVEMRAIGRVLHPDERNVLRKIMSHTGAALTVSDLFPNFKRESEAHDTLRRLRATHSVYPAKRGYWEADEPIKVTPFARLMWDHLGEARIFAAPPNKPKNDPADSHTPPPQQKLVTWDNFMECIQERRKALASQPAATPRG